MLVLVLLRYCALSIRFLACGVCQHSRGRSEITVSYSLSNLELVERPVVLARCKLGSRAEE